MAKRIDGQLPGLDDGGLPGQGGVPVYPPPGNIELDEFDLDVRFTPVHLDLEDEPRIANLTGCVCLGATGIDTGAGATCIKLCGQTRGVLCLSNYRCITIGNRTCGFCVTLKTCIKLTGCNLYTQHGTCNCPTPTSSGVECG